MFYALSCRVAAGASSSSSTTTGNFLWSKKVKINHAVIKSVV